MSILSRLRRQRPLTWEIRITCPEGALVDVDTEALYFIWKYGPRSTDGYLDILDGYHLDILQLPSLRVWVRPRGWEEPADRLAALDGTGAILPGWS